MLFEKFQTYLRPVRGRLMFFRNWGEPIYVSNTGGAIGIDWKKHAPDYCFVFSHCKTKWMDTSNVLYEDAFRFEENRVIVFHKDDENAVGALKHCLSLSPSVHKENTCCFVRNEELHGVGGWRTPNPVFTYGLTCSVLQNPCARLCAEADCKCGWNVNGFAEMQIVGNTVVLRVDACPLL